MLYMDHVCCYPFHDLFIHSSVCRPVGNTLAIENNAAISPGLKVSFLHIDFISFGCIPNRIVVILYDTSTFSYAVFTVAVLVYMYIQVCMNSFFFTSSTPFVILFHYCCCYYITILPSLIAILTGDR